MPAYIHLLWQKISAMVMTGLMVLSRWIMLSAIAGILFCLDFESCGESKIDWLHSRQCSVINPHNLKSSKCHGLEIGSDISGPANVAVWNLDRTSEGLASVAVWNLDRTSEGPASVVAWNLDRTPVGQSGGNQGGYCRVLYGKCALGWV